MGFVIWTSYTSQKMLRSSVTPPPEEYWSFLRKALFNYKLRKSENFVQKIKASKIVDQLIIILLYI